VSPAQGELVERAREAASRAWAPYSHFHVGAAVLGSNGEIIPGCNVESASYGISCCAERVALFSAVAQGVKPVRLAVSCVDAPADAPESSKTPCGACRQIILDLMGGEALIEIDGVGEFTALELLPKGFILPE
jgi:cytidine deaminase